MELIASHIWTE